MNSAPEDRRIGEYRLRELLAENATTRTWLADQTSIARRVLVEELKPEKTEALDAFLADIRAKAAVDHPLIASIYEASAEPGQSYYAYELLPGTSFAARAAAADPLVPARLAHHLRRIAEAQLHQEAAGHAATSLSLDAIHLDEHGVLRMNNLAVAGERPPERSLSDITHLGAELQALIADGQPGATRVHTLLSWMRGEGLDAPITWSQIRDFCLQIEQQLSDPLSIVSPTRAGQRGVKKRPIALIAILTGVGLLAIAVLAMKMRPPVSPPARRAALPGPVAVPAGSYPTPDGATATHSAFQLAAHETTISQYAEFLETLGVLDKDGRQTLFDHAEQPAEKKDHLPSDWSSVLPAAKANGTWRGLPISLDSPVTGVDWWDAAAYAEWKKGRLPTQDEWFAALRAQSTDPTRIPAATCGPISPQSPDRTPSGLIGMAGSVSEWTAGRAPNPANPLGEKFWIITGGSHLKPGSNALTREWTSDRTLRRADLGFRVLLPES